MRLATNHNETVVQPKPRQRLATNHNETVIRGTRPA